MAETKTTTKLHKLSQELIKRGLDGKRVEVVYDTVGEWPGYDLENEECDTELNHGYSMKGEVLLCKVQSDPPLVLTWLWDEERWALAAQ